ncbi:MULTISPECIES: hypothetical protein [Halorussus]|uniref:hypothetical protein n=1 Tax=Halorussus TaxID=1070314 RepID=UPI000E2129BA|nr:MULTISPECIES: hypothetical protein [Halorussus]NHN58024.1 hypothetical protein [Halorussus sp. JP-T4]
MTDQNRARSGEDDQIDRRTVLKGTAAAGLAGVGATGVGAAADASQSDELPHRITIEPGSQGQRVGYHFRVSGTVEPGPEAGTLGVDTIDGNVVQGEVGGTIEGNDDPVDDYLFSGAIAFADADGPLSVTLDINGGVDGNASDDGEGAADGGDAADGEGADDGDRSDNGGGADDGGTDAGDVVFGDDSDDDDDDDDN